jgi:hypothetical protein
MHQKSGGLAGSEKETAPPDAAGAAANGGGKLRPHGRFRSGSGRRCGMSMVIAWMAAEAEQPRNPEFGRAIGRKRLRNSEGACDESVDTSKLPAHQFPAKQYLAPEEVSNGVENESQNPTEEELQEAQSALEDPETERRRRIYRGRTVGMLRRYMRYSIETGRLPSLLGREFFRAKVTSYTVVTFEDRVIFVHDMEICLERLDEFSRQLIARHILQEHDRWATARLLGCNEKTVRRLTPMALDLLSEILLEVGLMDPLDGNAKKSCQGGLEGENSVTDCEDGENKF